MYRTRTMSFHPSCLAVAAASLFLALPAQSTVVLDTFGPGDTALGSQWSLINEQSLAVAFTLDTASTITDILTSIWSVTPGSFSLGIVAGSGLPSGAYVFSTVLTNPTANSEATGLSWPLDAGAYWLVSRSEGGAIGIWGGGGQLGNAWSITSSGTWQPSSNIDAPAARITVTAIPEPGTWALMLSGLAMCGAAVRLRCG